MLLGAVAALFCRRDLTRKTFYGGFLFLGRESSHLHPGSARTWEIGVAWLFRLLIVATGVVHVLQGKYMYALSHIWRSSTRLSVSRKPNAVSGRPRTTRPYLEGSRHGGPLHTDTLRRIW